MVKKYCSKEKKQIGCFPRSEKKMKIKSDWIYSWVKGFKQKFEDENIIVIPRGKRNATIYVRKIDR